MDKSMQVIVVYLLTHIGLIFFMYPTDIIECLETGHWSAILLGFAIHVALLAVYLKGLQFGAPNNVIDIYKRFGRWFAIVFLFPVALYFAVVIVITIRAYSEIVTLVFLDNTPLWAIMALLLAVSSLVAVYGVETIFRTGILVALLFSPALLLVFSLSFQNADWRYMLPLIDQRAASFSYVFREPFLLSFFAFTGGFLFLGFIPPRIPYKPRKVLLASAALLPMFMLSVYVPLLTFGQSAASLLQFPFITAVDTVNVSWLMFDRITLFFLLSLVGFVMIYISLVMWKTALMIRSVVTIMSPIVTILLLTASVFLACLYIPNWHAVERILWWNTLLRLYVMLVIPFVTLVLGFRLHRKGAAH
ncbi:GerAB/ArcD/ProY family transporter [Cohnella panacarvi]|uniref:GerAB/ArcD/ProY family transporter n=1 Tax=Cohnella panacarvi TaxID=400776 RepID=UPI00047A5C0D|nr:GerAB/ArcD/ProY family transporter [Cohnella panacarvi]